MFSFSNYPYALYATDVKFQPSFRPSGRFDETKRYFSKKHQLYGLKVECSVAYPGFAVDLSEHEPGSVSDLTIFLSQLEIHKTMLRKTDDEMLLEDNGEGSSDWPEYWGILVDKGYQGAQLHMRTIQPKKKPKGGVLTTDEIQRNKRVSSDRVLVENYFGHVCMLWKVSYATYKWGEKKFDLLTMYTRYTFVHLIII